MKPIGRIWGYAGLYNRVGFRDGVTYLIAPGAFEGSLSPTVQATVEHKESIYLGDTDDGSLRVWPNRHGLAMRLLVPDSEAGHELLQRLADGERLGASFRYRDSKFVATPDGSVEVLYKFYGISDVGPGENPSFKATVRHLRWEMF